MDTALTDVTILDLTQGIAGPFCTKILSGMGAEVLKIDLQQISIKGKTAEGLDAVGRGDSIAVHAIALLVTGRQDRSRDL